ncbi:MAG: MarC family protein [Sulfolobales archaeon]|nr:MarC family protein [Sulfolobales archaeon]MCX8186162.1 MarC family protein [Sulfolobales archaeon]MDW7969457.1 MarC family protein [Sulfolobales archaeon]
MVDINVILGLSVQLYAIMDPIAAIPQFMRILESLTTDEAKKIVVKTSLAIFVLLTLFTLGGNYILMLFGISITSLKIAGGIILMAVALDTLITGHKPSKIEVGEYIIVPLATPLIVGPGTMTLLIISTGVYGVGSTLISAYIAFTAVYLTLKLSPHILRLVGATFVNGLGRFMSLIIASFAAEMLLRGVKDLLMT